MFLGGLLIVVENIKVRGGALEEPTPESFLSRISKNSKKFQKIGNFGNLYEYQDNNTEVFRHD